MTTIRCDIVSAEEEIFQGNVTLVVATSTGWFWKRSKYAPPRNRAAGSSNSMGHRLGVFV